MTEPSRSSSFASAFGDEFSLQASVGGVRGMVESVLPVGVFSLVYAFGHDLVVSSAAAIGVSVLLVTLRLVTRQPVGPAVSGLLGVAVGAVVALTTGRAVNFFLVSILKNVGLGLVYGISQLVRWPFVGVILGFVLGEQTHWRTVPARMRAYQFATALWLLMCVVRLAFQVPLYLHNEAAGLGAASVPLGLPLYGLVLLLTWLVVRRVPVARPPAPAPVPVPAPEPGTAPEPEADRP